MRVTKIVPALAALVLMSGNAYGTKDEECLEHLSGSGSMDSNCFIVAAADMETANAALYTAIARSIPKGNPNAALLLDYMHEQDRMKTFCAINKYAGSKWKPDLTAPQIHNINDIAYFECIYDLRKAQNQHLQSILDLVKSTTD
ncbi:hypothetical protein PQR37_32110 [Paraburkholderia nemoris]|uniref:hypothetical protein n=1 Tax=Paraburkholderia nemoris TaxID=2793076 RepID=UPI001911C1BC|nr:hypothetical protein [Paraburkholderia nemoris]MBK5151698.1 hypothetical protein [Burkholderia sp. R-69608]CAE6957124.1 hypothetical protein R69608_06203 [Paraburkholderia nemoris]